MRAWLMKIHNPVFDAIAWSIWVALLITLGFGLGVFYATGR